MLRSALDATSRDVTGLTSDGWTGPAAREFSSGWSECSDGGNKIFDALTELAGSLGITASNYLDRDTRTADQISSLNL